MIKELSPIITTREYLSLETSSIFDYFRNRKERLKTKARNKIRDYERNRVIVLDDISK